ncbi:hypothetical protein [Streptomyces sp. SID486]|uniref:hypothetical protein n=2 Tax=unclassified Streptomyces TaxID=2593676 RepID=UPI0019282B55|nr:hypothetical protein [Streptomyces sp. SID486]
MVSHVQALGDPRTDPWQENPTMTPTPGAPQSAHPDRPGASEGVCSEFTVFAKIKPGHTEALRQLLADIEGKSADEGNRAAIQQIGTLHDARYVIFENGTRFMFASVFDGSWDTYIDDFARTVVGQVFEEVFSHTEGFPGIKDPGVKEWFLAHQAPAGAFFSAYPDLTVRQIWRDHEVDEAFEQVLDTPEFRAALENPANAQLLATPAFRHLLELAAS